MSLSEKLAKWFPYTQKLDKKYQQSHLENLVLKSEYGHALEDLVRWKYYAEELEQIKHVPEFADFIKMGQAVLEYRRVLSMLSAPDPVDARLKVEELFDKYNINLPDRPHD